VSALQFEASGVIQRLEADGTGVQVLVCEISGSQDPTLGQEGLVGLEGVLEGKYVPLEPDQ